MFFMTTIFVKISQLTKKVDKYIASISHDAQRPNLLPYQGSYEPRSLPVKAIFVITLKSNLHPIPFSLPYRGYEMSPGHSLSRDLLTAKTTSAKAQKIENST
jgi:hypothetical protein